PRKKSFPFIGRKDHQLFVPAENQPNVGSSFFPHSLDRSILAKGLNPVAHPHVTAIQRELANWLFYSLEPREHMRAPTPVREVHRIGIMGEELAAFLNILKAFNKPQFQAIEKALHMIIPSITGIDVIVNTYGEVELKLIEGQTPIASSLLSDGTLRAL